MPTEDATRQDWSRLNPGDHVTVAEFGQESYRATVDILTPDMTFIWILPVNGATRKVFDCREDIVIAAFGDAAPNASRRPAEP